MNLFWQRLDLGFRRAMPSATTMIMTLLSVIIWPLPYLGSVMPPWGLIALYYWSLHRPDLFPFAVAFLVGLLNDLINDFPPGATALLFTLARQVLWRQRRFFSGHSFLMLWCGFAITAMLMMVSAWLLIGLLHWQFAPPLPVLIQTVLLILVFPLPCWILIRLQRSVLSST